MKKLSIFVLTVGLILSGVVKAAMSPALLAAAHRRNNSAFDPATLPGIKVYLNGDTLTGINGSAQTAWADSSSNGNNASGTATLATSLIGGKKGLTFDGSTQFMVGASSMGLTPPFTVVAVGYVSSGTVGTFVDATSPRSILAYETSGTSALLWSSSYSTPATGVSTSGSVVMGIYNGSSSLIRVDATQTSVGTPGTNGMGTYFLGGYSDPVLRQINLCTVIICDGVMSGPNITALEAYLKAKYSTP